MCRATYGKKKRVSTVQMIDDIDIYPCIQGACEECIPNSLCWRLKVDAGQQQYGLPSCSNYGCLATVTKGHLAMVTKGCLATVTKGHLATVTNSYSN